MAAEIAMRNGSSFNYAQAQEAYNWLAGAPSQYETARQRYADVRYKNDAELALRKWCVEQVIHSTGTCAAASNSTPAPSFQEIYDWVTATQLELPPWPLEE